MGEPLDSIRREIDDHGPITFGRFMELALYGPDAFYAEPPVGMRGDFVTSPHVHPVFGTILWRAIRELWEDLGRPDPLRLAEVGAGDGSLATLLAAASDVRVTYTAVERSGRGREMLAAIPGIDARERLDGPVDVVVCNELLDNLAVRRLRGDREVRIGLDGDHPIEILAPAEPGLTSSPSDGDERISPVGAFAFIDELARSIDRGYALLIDYGALGSTGGPVHGYRGHEIVEDVLADPGTADITVGVDFELIASHAEATGLLAFPTVTQHDALLVLGLGDWLEDELRRQRTELQAGDGRDAVATWSGRSRATLLVDPGSLGRLRWLLLATPDLEAPAWLTSAIAQERVEDR